MMSLNPGPCRKVLVLFSDMRNSTRALDLEQPQVLAHSVASQSQQTVRPDLYGVAVYALGVDGANRTIFYCKELQQFWTQYLMASGATASAFTVLRVLPEFSNSEW